VNQRRGHFVAGAIRAVAALVVVSIGILAPVDVVHAQDDAEKDLGWSFTADLAAVWTGGNSESSTYGLDALLLHKWTKSEIGFQAGGTQTESSLKTRTAVGTSVDDFMLNVDKKTEKTAEMFYARARYDYNISKRFYLLGGVDWLRNTFSGIDSRTLVGLGAGNTWSDNEKVRFMTNYAFTYTFQSEVVQNPFTKNEFPGVRVGYNLWWKLTTSTEFLSWIAVDWNLDNTDDVRIDFTNALPVSISEKLELKPSLQLLWRNDPALTEVGLYAPDGTPTGDTVLVPLEELDTFFTLALVVKL
jgi:putative salt-induced outer membrane protein YdiY